MVAVAEEPGAAVPPVAVFSAAANVVVEALEVGFAVVDWLEDDGVVSVGAGTRSRMFVDISAKRSVTTRRA